MRSLMRLFAFVLLLAPVPASAQDLTVLKVGPDGGSPRAMLANYLKAEAGKAFDARRAAVAAVKTPDDLARRQRDLKSRFFKALGDLPEKTPLNARVVGTEARDGYRVERVIFESRPDHHVTALFYLPAGTGPFPAVLMPCGHDTNGKAAAGYQKACILLARVGIAALCYDPIGQAERRQVLDADGKPSGPGGTTEHTLAHVGALLVGRSVAGYRVWDGIRGLDYLASRPEVDPNRLGCTGCSGGGTLTSYLMALDDRVAVAAPSCYITSLERLFATLGPQDGEQNITGQVAFGLEHADYLGLRAPRPTLILASSRDFFDQQGTWTSFREAKKTYGLLGHPERVEIIEADEPHGYPRPHREAMAGWMRRWLLGKDEGPPTEQEERIAPDADLQCTKSGQVLADLKGKSVFDLNADRAAELAEARAKRWAGRGKGERLADVRRLIALRDPIEPARREDRGETERRQLRIRKLVFAPEPGIALPALMITPLEVDRAGPMTVMVGFDAAEVVKLAGPIEDWLKHGPRVLLVDLRGMGETSPAAGKPGLVGGEAREAYQSLHLGRPLLGQRVGDLLAVLAAMAGESPGGFALVGRGAAGPVALHAAALDPRVVALEVEGSIASWADVVRTPLSRDQFGSVVPGVLASYDLPELATLFAPRPLTIGSAVDPEGRPMAQARVNATYSSATDAYRSQGMASALALKVGPPVPKRAPLFGVVDLAIGETQSVALPDGKTATVKLVAVDEPRDPIRGAIREPRVKVEINGKSAELRSGNYNLPIAAGGVQVDCPITGGYRGNASQDAWGLEKDARIRVWPAGSPWIEPAAFLYPARQRWFASMTQMANEPTYVDGGETTSTKKIYYHSGLDIGGAEGMVEVVAATDGVVVSVGTKLLSGFEGTPASPRYDVVYVLDDRGWFYRYSHLQSIDPAITPGASVKMGQKVGVLGKEGASGGWSHLHFEIKSKQPSGRWGTEEGYAFLWQAALREQKPEVVAVARPHHLTRTGDPVALDGSKSWSRSGPIDRYEWTFGDGTTATGPRVERTYDRPGTYSETLKVTDGRGKVAYDFAAVQVLDRDEPGRLPPTIHASYSPTMGIKPGDAVTFKVRTFRTTDGRETWDFGDGSPPVTVQSDGNAVALAKDGYAVTTHRYDKPGHYLVRVERANGAGASATARLSVTVEGARE